MPVLRSFLLRLSALPTAIRWTAVLAEMGTLWWLSSREPLLLVSSTAGSMLHNTAHVVAYTGLAATIALALCRVGPLRTRELQIAVLAAAIYGAVDELHQMCVPGRVASWSDLGSDVAGAHLGAFVVQYGWSGQRRWILGAIAALGFGLVTAAVATFTDY